MRKLYILIFSQAALCALETWLILKISLIGKIGIALVHREYRVFRSGWKTFGLFFGLQLAVIGVLLLVQKKYSRKILQRIAWILIGAAMVGLVATYLDFMNIYSHRLLKERFHLGFYIFWLSWIGSCTLFLIHKNERVNIDSWPQDVNAPTSS